MDARTFKDAVYGHLARLGRALAAPKRIELLELLCQAPRTVEALAAAAGASVANTSQHLQVLYEAGLVTRERRGRFVRYQVAEPAVCRFYHELRTLAERRLAEIERLTERFFGSEARLDPIDREELLRRVRARRAVVVDVRPLEEYREGHLPGAISIPLPELEARLAELPRDAEVVAYCRGPYCVLAAEAVALLRARGFRAMRLADDVVAWRARGYELEHGDIRGGAR